MDVGENNKPLLKPDVAVTRDAGDAQMTPHLQRRLRRIVRATLLLLLVLALIRVFVFEPYAIPTGSMRPTILEGDVVLVNKLPYVVRTLRYIPFTRIPLPHLVLPGLGTLERGDVVVFDFPAATGTSRGAGEQFVKRCVAIAGDTVHLVSGRIRVNGNEVPVYGPGLSGRDGEVSSQGLRRGAVSSDDVRSAARRAARRAAIDARRAFALLRYGSAITVPFTGHTIALDSVAASRWSNVIYSEGVTIEYRNRIVFIDGLPATYYTFRRDYFFALGDNSADSHDSRFFGFVPVANLIGQAWLVYWSRDPNNGFRGDHIGTIIR